MTASKLSDLIPLDPSVTNPTPYQVFGLVDGEADRDKIKSAVKAVYHNLKQAKATADPATWNQAAALVESARKQLSQQAAATDSSLGQPLGAIPAATSQAAPPQATTPQPAAAPAADPLADLLPGGSSTAAADPNAVLGLNPQTSAVAPPLGMPPLGSAPATNVLGSVPAQPAAAPQPAPVASAGPVAAVSPAAPAWKPRTSSTRRRKRSSIMPVLFGLTVLGMIGCIGFLLWYINQPGEPGGGRTVIAAAPTPNPGKAPSKPRPKGDGVMGEVPSSGTASSVRNGGTRSGSGLSSVMPGRNPGMAPVDTGNGITMTGNSGNNPAMVTPMPEPNLPTPEPTKPEPEEPEPMEPEPTEPEPMEPETPNLTPEMVLQGDQELAAVTKLIQSAEWDQMKDAAEKLSQKKELTDEQRKRADSLYDIADLASFYRGAITRGLGTLKAGATFEVAPGLPVVVSEANSDGLSIMVDKRVKSYTVDSLPERLTEKLAEFALDADRPDSVAGLALYRLIHPKTNDEYKADAYSLLQSVDGQLEMVDTESLQAVAQDIFK